MSNASGTQSRRQLITVIVLASALALSVIALVISLVQLTKEKHSIQSAADNAQVVTKEIAADSGVLNSSIAQANTDISNLSQQSAAVAKGATANAADAATQAKANAALSDGMTKVSTGVTNLTTAVTGMGTSISAQQNASGALVTLLTDVQNDPQVGLTALGSNATNLSTQLNDLVSQHCSGSSQCSLTAADFNSIIAMAADVSSGLTAQNTAFADPSPAVSSLAASKAINTGLTAIQTQGAQAVSASKLVQADMKTVSTGLTDASTSAKKLSDNAAKLSQNATALDKSTTGLAQSSSVLASQGASFDQTIQDLSKGAYQPDLAELSLPAVAIYAIVGAMLLLVALVIWMAVVIRRRQSA
ncbi:MAG: hypothetical protein ACOYBP_04080 [Microbacteriaceae bacterium]